MKIKRYMAVSMRTALAQVRQEQGPDAVILSSRRVDEGIEVIAAVDYDEALFADATVRRAPLPPEADAKSDASTPVPAPVPAAPPSAASAPSRPTGFTRPDPEADRAIARIAAAPVLRVPVQAPVPREAVAAARVPPSRSLMEARALDGGFLAMQKEVHDLRVMLRGELAHMSWNDKRLREPLQARVLEELTALDLAPDVAMMLATLTPRTTRLENAEHIPLAMLAKHVPVVDKLSTVNGGVIALVGPTGAGKTTTIAKLAARWAMQHGPKDLALVSTDGYRIGAREQLMTYARILGAPMHVANSGKELAKVLDRLKSKKLVLIDTAGMGPRDVRLSEQLAALQLGAARARVLLTLPAHGEANALEEIVKSFARVSPVACILTKIDEAASLGAALSITLRHKLRIAYLCTGQRVPEDLHAAHERRLWLVRMAAKLRQNAPPRNPAYYARNFGGASAHA